MRAKFFIQKIITQKRHGENRFKIGKFKLHNLIFHLNEKEKILEWGFLKNWGSLF